MGNHQYTLQNSYGPEVMPHERTSEHLPEPVYYPSSDQVGIEVPKEIPSASGPVKEQKRIFGLPKRMFIGLSVAFAVLIVLGVGVGVGVAVGTSKRHGDSSEQSPTNVPAISSVLTSSESQTPPASETPPASKTSSAPVTSGTVGIASNTCTSKDPQTYRTDKGTTFVEFCFTDWPKGVRSPNSAAKVVDLDAIIVYTFESCMDKCEEYNVDLTESQTKCWAVTYNSNLTGSVGGQGANCFLKDRRGTDVLAGGTTASAGRAL